MTKESKQNSEPEDLFPHVFVEAHCGPMNSYLVIGHHAATLSFTRDEAFDLFEKISAKLGELPVKI